MLLGKLASHVRTLKLHLPRFPQRVDAHRAYCCSAWRLSVSHVLTAAFRSMSSTIQPGTLSQTRIAAVAVAAALASFGWLAWRRKQLNQAKASSNNNDDVVLPSRPEIVSAFCRCCWVQPRPCVDVFWPQQLDVTLTLYESQLTLLQDAVALHSLGTVSRALRCIINYSRGVRPPAAQEQIWTKMRCGRCGGGAGRRRKVRQECVCRAHGLHA